MANLLSRKQVAALIGKGESYVGTYIRRKHLIEKNKRIDTDLKKNKEFLSKFITKEIERVEENGNIESSSPGKNTSTLDRELKEHELKLKKIKIKKEELDLSKKQAKLIEILEAKDIMNRAIITLSSQYRQKAKQYLLDLAASYEIPDKDLAGIQKAFDENINKAVAESKTLIKSECKVVASNYADTLMQGESND